MRTLVVIASLFMLLGCKKSQTETVEERSISTVDPLKISEKLIFDFKPLFDTTHLEKVSIGELYLSTGEIVASDPFLIDDVKPFNKKVDKGSYPVEVLIHKVEDDHYRIAFARIKFSDTPAIRWELALTDDVSKEAIDSLQRGEFFGYSVEGGLGCFADLETVSIFTTVTNANENYYEDVLEDEFKNTSGKHPLSRAGGDWDNHFPRKGDKHNMIMFSSGWGDGFYPTYWGTDSTGKIVELITDFGVVGTE